MSGVEQCRVCGVIVDDGSAEEPEGDNWISCHTTGIGAMCHRCYEPTAGLPPPLWPQPLPQEELDKLASLQETT